MARDALANLVNQFAHPLDFLRELAQNAIDAGSPRVDVYTTWEAAPKGLGVLAIHVDDYGAGMDEAIVDGQLTRLFSSNKEDDVTKIGKFGIGFVSIFAMEPDLVRLLTGRHGEAWELIFHPDRTFEKRAHAEAVQGTTITLYKRMPAAQRDATVREVERVLRYWCEHSRVPITFADRTGGRASAANPFAMFGEGDDDAAIVVSGPLTAGVGVIEVPVQGDGVQGTLAYGDHPRYGFYNGGLTLVNTENPLVLGAAATTLAPLSLKVQCDKLGHTLARDGVVQDAAWSDALECVARAIPALQAALLDEAERREGEALEQVQRFLLTELRRSAASSSRWSRDGWLRLDAGVFRDGALAPVSCAAVEKQASRLGAVLFDPGPGVLRDELLRLDATLLHRTPAAEALLVALFPGYQGLIASAEALFVAPDRVDRARLDDTERALLDRLSATLAAASGGRLSVVLGDFGGMSQALDEALALEGAGDARVFRRPEPRWFALPRWLRWRTLILNRNHPSYQTHLASARENVDLGAFPLAQLLLRRFDYAERAVMARLMEAFGE